MLVKMLLVMQDRVVFKKETVLVKTLLVIWHMGGSSIHEDSNQGRKQVKGQGKNQSRRQIRGKDTSQDRGQVMVQNNSGASGKTIVKAQDKVKKVKVGNNKEER